MGRIVDILTSFVAFKSDFHEDVRVQTKLLTLKLRMRDWADCYLNVFNFGGAIRRLTKDRPSATNEAKNSVSFASTSPIYSVC